MKYNYRWMVVILCIACLQLSACGPTESATASDPKPAKVEHLGDAVEPTRETLTEDAAKRLDIQTATVRDMVVNGTQQKVIPYSAIVYDNQGNTWTYTNPAPLTFFRHHITVDHIEGDLAILSDGPASGTAVVTVGAEELYGAEFEFQEE